VVLGTWCAMQCAEVKSHDIAYFGGENTQMWVIFQYFWGGKVLKTLCICDICLLVHKFPRNITLSPTVAPSNTA
jgi:hypothetical protein